MPTPKAEFLYTNASGETTLRSVTVHSIDDTYLRGWCEFSHGVRTFRRDRIQPITDPADLSVIAYPTPSIQPVHKKPALMQVHFTGFKSDDKKHLIETALQAGMEVRQSVTSDLAILVYGYNASKKKVQKAEQQGSLILTEEQFFEILDSGALPSEITNTDCEYKNDESQHQIEEMPEGWDVSHRHPGYYWQVHLCGVADPESIISECKGKPFVFWKTLAQNTELLVIGERRTSASKLEHARERGIAIITIEEFKRLVIPHGIYPKSMQYIEPYIIYRGSSDDGDIIDPIPFFSGYAYRIKHSHYPAFNINLDSERILGRVPSITLKNCYSLKKCDWFEFCEGDVFYPIGGDETTGVKLITANIDQVEVLSFSRIPQWSAVGYHITPEQFAKWLETGTHPDATHQISRHQSRSGIAQWHEYTGD